MALVNDRLRRISVPLVIGGLAVVLAASLWGFGSRDGVRATAVFSPAAGSASPADPPEPTPLPAWWPRRLTLYTDSVGLGAVTALRDTMASWRVKVLGRPALMLDDAAQELADEGTDVDRVSVVALGYNSLWEHGREDFDYYARTFDQDAARLIRALHAAGARKIVWVLLRDAPRPVIPTDSLDQTSIFRLVLPVRERAPAQARSRAHRPRAGRLVEDRRRRGHHLRRHPPRPGRGLALCPHGEASDHAGAVRTERCFELSDTGFTRPLRLGPLPKAHSSTARPGWSWLAPFHRHRAPRHGRIPMWWYRSGR